MIYQEVTTTSPGKKKNSSGAESQQVEDTTARGLRPGNGGRSANGAEETQWGSTTGSMGNVERGDATGWKQRENEKCHVYGG